jgi:hypothetical protein
MIKFIKITFLITIMGVFHPIWAIDGFFMWSKYSGCNSELHYTELNDMKPEVEKVVIEKDSGADISPVISYDGEWIAWCRSEMTFNSRYGKCDYHSFGRWNIYYLRSTD